MLCQFRFLSLKKKSWAGAHYETLFDQETFLSHRCSLLSVKLDKCHRVACNSEASVSSVVTAYTHFFSLSDSLRNPVPAKKTLYHISRLKAVAWNELLHPSHPGNVEVMWYSKYQAGLSCLPVAESQPKDVYLKRTLLAHIQNLPWSSYNVTRTYPLSDT